MKHKLKTIRHKIAQPGVALPVSILLMFIIMILGLSALNMSTRTYSVIQSDNLNTHAQLASDAGIEDAIQNISEDNTWTPASGEVGMMDENGVRTTYQLTMSDGASVDEKILRSTGRTYQPASATEASATRTHEIQLSLSSAPSAPTGLSGNYSVIAGPGGLLLTTAASIQGNVFVGGELSLSIDSSITTGPGGLVQVADNRCGTAVTYPQACVPSDGMGQPVSITGTASINGLVNANNQTSSTGMSSPGLVSGSVTPFKFPAPPDRQPIKDATEAGTVLTRAQAGCSSGTKSWPANTKVSMPANQSVNIAISCQLTVHGNVWINGGLSIAGNASIRVAEGLTEKPIIMIDGRDGLRLANSSAIHPNSSGVGARFVTYYSEASCSPECTDVTGKDLKDSIDIASTIDIGNNVGTTEGSEFFAAWTSVTAANSSTSAALAGQSVKLGNVASIPGGTFVTLPTPSGGGGSSGSGITAHSYRRIYN